MLLIFVIVADVFADLGRGCMGEEWMVWGRGKINAVSNVAGFMKWQWGHVCPRHVSICFSKEKNEEVNRRGGPTEDAVYSENVKS